MLAAFLWASRRGTHWGPITSRRFRIGRILLGMAAAFDTLSAAKQLQAAGFDQAQAEAVASVVRAGQGGLATKNDIDAVRTELRTELTAIKWVLGLVAALNVAILVRLLLG